MADTHQEVQLVLSFSLSLSLSLSKSSTASLSRHVSGDQPLQIWFLREQFPFVAAAWLVESLRRRSFCYFLRRFVIFSGEFSVTSSIMSGQSLVFSFRFVDRWSSAERTVENTDRHCQHNRDGDRDLSNGGADVVLLLLLDASLLLLLQRRKAEWENKSERETKNRAEFKKRKDEGKIGNPTFIFYNPVNFPNLIFK